MFWIRIRIGSKFHGLLDSGPYSENGSRSRYWLLALVVVVCCSWIFFEIFHTFVKDFFFWKFFLFNFYPLDPDPNEADWDPDPHYTLCGSETTRNPIWNKFSPNTVMFPPNSRNGGKKCADEFNVFQHPAFVTRLVVVFTLHKLLVSSLKHHTHKHRYRRC